MAYAEDKNIDGLDELTSIDATDVRIVGDTSDANRAKKITRANELIDNASATQTLTNKTINTASNTITVVASDVSDFDTEVANNSAVTANTAKVTYPSADSTKLSGIETGAEVNNISDVNATDLTDAGDSALHFHATDRARANHTGTQTASTISDFDTEVSNNSSVTANTAKVTYNSTDSTKVGFISVTQAVDLDTMESNITTNNAKVTNATHTGDVTGDTTLTIGAGKVTEAMQVLADNTTNDVSTSKHGYAPKGDGTTTKFLNANGAYSVPAGSGGTPEGTAVLSTGETVGKVLQADGDDTCSWVALGGGGDALVANPLSQFASTTSAQLAGVISDETGSGKVVFGTSPTLVTPVLGTPSSGNLSSCTNYPTGTKTAEGALELATTAEIDTGTDTTRAIPVDQLVASKRNVRWLVFNLVEADTACATATNIAGDFVSPIAGTILQSDTTPFYLYATNSTAGTTGTMVVDISIGGTSIMTTNKLDFDTTEKTTTTAATPPDLTTTTLSVGDIITIDIDSVHTTAAKGLTVYIGVRE